MRLLPLIIPLVPLVALADEPITPGHSMHGEAFNEGPRQAARLIPGTGDVHFTVTTKSSDAQRFFDQGVGQLHGFWYYEAERSFRQVAALDPDCAMAYWGMAMANVNTPKRASDFIKEAKKRREKMSPREQQWIDAWTAYFADDKKDEKARRTGLVKALEDYLYTYPDEIEAKAFLVLQLWDNQQHDIPLPSRLAVDALAQQVLEKAPMHPGIHHYLIHLWNHKDGDKRAVLSAERSGLSAPGIAHLWHMSGHTFSELKRYPEAAWRQEASARTDHAYMAASRIMPEQIHNYAHNNDWLVQDLGYIGRVHEAVDLAKNLIELPKLGPGKQQAWRMGRDRLLQTALTFELWDTLTALESTPYLSPESDPQRELVRMRTLGVAWFSKGDRERGQQKLDALKDMLASTRRDRLAAADKAEADSKKDGKSDEQIAKAMADAMRSFARRIDDLDQSIAELRLVRALAANDLDAVKAQLPLAKGIASQRLARIRSALGEHETAEKLARDLIKADSGQVLGHALLAEVLWRAGKRDAALDAFRALRERSAYLDLDVPAFARMAPLAAELKLPADWRTPAPAISPELPPLAKLGPFRWQPYEAPAFMLPRDDKRMVSLGEFSGKPVLVVFYLGAGCTRCIEQLNALAPLAKDYTAAGIQIVAIGTDTPEGLFKTFELAKDTSGFPFPILSDHECTAFKAYRAYDDFEHQPLHGAFLLDGHGKVRWQNISFQPFTDLKWLLEESKRLLGLPAALSNIASTAH